MVSVLAFVHIVISIFLVILVLIQDPKGGAAGGMFGGGGGSNSLFGATGAPTFLARLTRWVAALFAASCILMTISIKPGGNSVLDQMDMPAATAPIESQQDMIPESKDPQPEGEQPQPEKK